MGIECALTCSCLKNDFQELLVCLYTTWEYIMFKSDQTFDFIVHRLSDVHLGVSLSYPKSILPKDLGEDM